MAPVAMASTPPSRTSDRFEKPSCFAKTKMCKFHILGLCAFGEECQFAHAPEQLNRLPDFTCTKLCKTLRETGECRDPTCSFAHSAEHLRSSSTVFVKTKMCRFFKMGHCSLGLKCNFAHDPVEVRMQPHLPEDWPEQSLRALREVPFDSRSRTSSGSGLSRSQHGSHQDMESLASQGTISIADALASQVTFSSRDADLAGLGNLAGCSDSHGYAITKPAGLVSPKPVGLVREPSVTSSTTSPESVGSGRRQWGSPVASPTGLLRRASPESVATPDSPIFLLQMEPDRPGCCATLGSMSGDSSLPPGLSLDGPDDQDVQGDEIWHIKNKFLSMAPHAYPMRSLVEVA